jgi:DNA-binding beta-propeller fold protein YncE
VRLVGWCAAALTLLAAPAAVAMRPPAQPLGPAGCVDPRGVDGCAAAPLLAGLEPTQMAVSPNGRFVYSSQQAELIPGPHAPHSRLLVFARDLRTGALHPLRGRRGCLEDTVRPVARQRGPCERVGGIELPFALVISPDGRHLYVSGGGGRNNGGDYLVTFGLDPRTGSVRPLQCLTDQAHSRCAYAAIGSAGDLLVSPDSRDVYAADERRAVIDVYRVGAHGLAFAQCLASTPQPGKNCTIAPLLMEGGVEGLAVSRDGSELYAAGLIGEGAGRIVEFSRDAASGLLSAGSATGDCVSDALSPPLGCAKVALTGRQLSLSASGDTLYAASGPELAVAALSRDASTGALSEAPPPSGCVEFTSFPERGCSSAPRWSSDFPHTVSSRANGLLVSALEEHDDAGTVVEVTRSPAGGAPAVSDLRGCAAGACRRLRGTNGELAGALAASPDGRSVYVADKRGIAQIRVPP